MIESNQLIVLNFAEAKQPTYREKKGEGYVMFGDDNLYPHYLLELFNKSAKHNAIVKSKVNYITGNGWKAQEGDVAAEAFIKQPNRYESLAELTRKVSMDIELFGGAYLEVIWSMVGGQISEVTHVDYTRIRTTADNTAFYYRKNWEDRREKTDIIPAFNTNIRQGRQILYIKEYRPGLDAYSLPGYIGALNYIQSDVLVSEHVLGNAQTGFSASKMITLPNGEPGPEEKRNIERRFTDRFSGADGKKFVLSFVTDAQRKPIIEDLGSSDLTKEDFGRVDSMIQQNIFSAHQLTSPALFGISEPGKLGTRSELRDAYEIFKNTYVNDKQQALEEVFTKLAMINGATSEITIIPVEPISLELSEAAILTVAPKEWIAEKAGIDLSKYDNPSVTPDGTTIAEQAAEVNENLKNLTGRQNIQLLRIIRQFSQGKITKEIAMTMMRSGFGLSDSEIMTMLGIEEEGEQFSQVYTMDETVQMFASFGVHKKDYEEMATLPMAFAEVEDEADKRILDILKKQPLTPVEDIASGLRISVRDTQARIDRLIEAKIIIVDTRTKALRVPKPLSELIDKKPKTTFEIVYDYTWKSIVPTSQRNTAAHPSRPFCVKLMELDRYWTRREIENLTQRLGYSVFDRAGGWWTMHDGERSPSCRHEWTRKVVVKKNK